MILVTRLDFLDILQQELIPAGVLPEDYAFEAHKEPAPMQPGDVPVTYADIRPSPGQSLYARFI